MILLTQQKIAQDSATAAYNNAVEAEATAVEAKTLAQSTVDGQTVTVATALTNKNNAQDALDIANFKCSNNTGKHAISQWSGAFLYCLQFGKDMAKHSNARFCDLFWNLELKIQCNYQFVETDMKILL